MLELSETLRRFRVEWGRTPEVFMKAQRSLEEKLQIVLAGLKGQDIIAELCRRHGLSETAFYHWQKLCLRLESAAKRWT